MLIKINYIVYILPVNDTSHSKGDHDVSEEHEDSAAGPSEPSYPPVSSMDHVTGYENVDSEGGKCCM